MSKETMSAKVKELRELPEIASRFMLQTTSRRFVLA